MVKQIDGPAVQHRPLAFGSADRDTLATRMREHARAEIARSVQVSRQLVSRIHSEMQELRRAESARRAAYRFEHADDLMRLAYIEPRKLLQRPTDRVPRSDVEPPSAQDLRQFAGDPAWWWQRLQERLRAELAREHYNGPVIWDVPETIEVGSEAAILGERFGSSAGRVDLKDCNGAVHPLQLLGWSETAVHVKVPDTITGIPFDCAGWFSLRRADSLVEGHNTAVAAVDIEPNATDRWVSTATPFAQSDYAVFDTYSGSHDFESAVLPSSFRQTVPPDDGTGLGMTWGCVKFMWWDNLIRYSADEGVKITVTSGPVVSGDKLVISTDLADDHVWDFEITADFYIKVPNGIPAPGWRMSST